MRGRGIVVGDVGFENDFGFVVAVDLDVNLEGLGTLGKRILNRLNADSLLTQECI
jgi:hypothetical protein